MNVLVLSNNEVVEYQGAGYVIKNTANSLKSLGYSVDIIEPYAFKVFSFLKSRAYIYRMILGMALWVFKNRRSLQKYQLIILYGSEACLALFLIKFIFKFNVPVILHSNGLEQHVDYRLQFFKEYFEVKKWYHIDKSFIYKYFYKNVDGILTVSKFEMNFAINHLNINANKVFFNEPCLPDLFFKNNNDPKFLKKKIISYCGTWITRKGIDIIKIVIPDILRMHNDYTFRIIGVGREFHLQDHFPEDVIRKIEVYPLVEDKNQLINLYQESNIFLFPSLYESFGLVVAEAMFCECAVVTSSTGFGADLQNNIEAIILEEVNIVNVRSALEKLIISNEFCFKLSKNGGLRTQILNWNNYTANLDIILKRIIFQKHNKYVID